MKKGRLFMFGIVMNAITVLSMIIFVILNLENLTCEFSWGLLGIFRPSISLNERYHDLLQDIYGCEKGHELFLEIEDFTIWMINHNINLILFAIISLMMLLCVVINKKQHKKMDKILKVYFIICFILMFIATFIAGPEYIDLIYGD